MELIKLTAVHSLTIGSAARLSHARCSTIRGLRPNKATPATGSYAWEWETCPSLKNGYRAPPNCTHTEKKSRPKGNFNLIFSCRCGRHQATKKNTMQLSRWWVNRSFAGSRTRHNNRSSMPFYYAARKPSDSCTVSLHANCSNDVMTEVHTGKYERIEHSPTIYTPCTKFRWATDTASQQHQQLLVRIRKVLATRWNKIRQ